MAFTLEGLTIPNFSRIILELKRGKETSFPFPLLLVLSQNKNTGNIITKGEYILSFYVPHQIIYGHNWNDGSSFPAAYIYDGTVIASIDYKFTMCSDDFIVYTTTVPAKSVKLSGGLNLRDNTLNSSRATDYVKEHIEDFKAKTYEAMPEARKATNIPSVRVV